MDDDLQHPEHTGQELAVGDVTLYYEVHGAASGIPLFVVNGGPGLDHSYVEVAAVWQELAARRPVVFYDQRGNGRSSHLAEGQPCGLADQLTDLDALQQHLSFEQVDLLGHSFGGNLAMAYTARYPRHVHKLILVGRVRPNWATRCSSSSTSFPKRWRARMPWRLPSNWETRKPSWQTIGSILPCASTRRRSAMRTCRWQIRLSSAPR